MIKLTIGVALISTAISPVVAQDVLSGTWKGDISASQLSTKPSSTLIDKGLYTCATCKPVVKVVADGGWHAVAGQPYYDEMSVTVVDPAVVKYATKKGGKIVSEATETVSADGKSIATAFSETVGTTGVPITGTSVSERVTPAPAGAHATSGSWRQTKDAQVSDSGLTFTFAQVGKVVTYSTPIGISFAATIGGPAVPVTGDPGWTTGSLTQPSARTLHETDMFEGKVTGKFLMTVSPDGKTMTIDVNDIKRGKTSTLVAYKQ